MPKFLIHTQQSGGCDYTIGCGHRIDIITADNLLAAKLFVEQHWFGLQGATLMPDSEDEFDGEYAVHQSDGIKRVAIYEIANSFSCDVEGLFRAVEQGKAERARVTKEAKDRAHYEALKAKFEGRG